ncbi:MAG: DUF128 domain-containing protein [Candidatus Margulisbacteria bacterium]|nr:DUF128 domain-containing protein [Candidatus Margulisiibacteriota bacterium]MBU1021297.1 DUF128 domain-containing protein [Candidatus Margulisiibacteriota bacterium]MBU1729214.1 DUF128 domain-containing protein [Candidatus Margulisiibacteriota bacterium]MBU1954887.1 DUF128 domain-containing protein [Candidatus Margulisiibacteriota bacterium]
MTADMERKTSAILRIIAESSEPVGSKDISDRLKEFGIDLTERAVRYHLKIMDEQKLTESTWKEGRTITKMGKEELANAWVSEKVGLVSSRIESKAYLMDFDLNTKSGKVILNISLFNKNDFKGALKIMRDVFKKKLGMGDRVLVAEAGEEVGDMVVPQGKICFGSLCTINLNGILLKHSIPLDSKFGGILQIEKGKPLRFTDLIRYSGSTLDPHEIFIRSKMTSVRDAVKGSGKILAGLREIPAVSKQDVESVLEKAEAAGFGGALYIGKEEEPVLGMPVGIEKVGLVVPGGLNPVAACEECGIKTESKALVTLVEYNRLKKFNELIKR